MMVYRSFDIVYRGNMVLETNNNVGLDAAIESTPDFPHSTLSTLELAEQDLG